MNTAQRADLLKNCVAQLVAAHSVVRSRDEQVTPKHAFWIAADALVDAFDDEHGDIPACCRRIFVAVWGNGEGDQGGFKKAWNRWKTREETKQNPTWKPGPDVWSAYRNLKEQMRVQVTAPRRLVEPVAELVAQGVNDDQIARIYERMNQFGAPDLEWVRTMKSKPELNTDETRMVQRAKVETSSEQWGEYAAMLASQPEIQRFRQLLEQGIDPEGASDAHARRSIVDHGGPKLAFGNNYARSPAQREESESFVQPPPMEGAEDWDSPITVEQRAVMLMDEGVEDNAIVQQLGISGQKLGAVKRNADRIRESLPQMAEA